MLGRMKKVYLSTKQKSLILFLLLIPLAILYSRTSSAHILVPENRSLKESSEGNHFISQEGQTTLYLPLIQKVQRKYSFLGIIMPIYWSSDHVDTYMPEADALAGKKHTAVGWGIDVQDPALVEPWANNYDLNKNNLYRQLEQLWLRGYVSFVKIGSSTTIREIADGQYDDQLNQMAQLYKRWLQNGGGRKAMFAPFQEMNGTWVPYYYPGSTPAQKQEDFKDAYRHVFEVFQSNGVDRSQIWWVFAPNGGSELEDIFEYYYPGDNLVDLVGFASYNYGFCDATVKPDGSDYGKWENYDTIYEPYINRMQIMAPTKPIIISETGSSAITSREARDIDQYDYAAKAAWFELNYDWLAAQPMVLGIFYFDFSDLGNGVTCDLEIPRTDFDGYKIAAANPDFQYLPREVLEKYIP
jgi:hypothetical protein